MVGSDNFFSQHSLCYLEVFAKESTERLLTVVTTRDEKICAPTHFQFVGLVIFQRWPNAWVCAHSTAITQHCDWWTLAKVRNSIPQHKLNLIWNSWCISNALICHTAPLTPLTAKCWRNMLEAHTDLWKEVIEILVVSKFPFDICRSVCSHHFQEVYTYLYLNKVVVVSEKKWNLSSVTQFIICIFHHIVHKPIAFCYIPQYRLIMF